MNYSSSISRFFTDRSCLLAHLLFSVVSPTAHRLFTRPSRHFIFTGIKCCDNALISIPCLHSRTDMVPFSINASTSLFFIFCQKSFLLSFIWGLYCCFLPSKWDQNGLILGTKNSENTLRIQSCYYISLQKSPIVASISSIGKKSRDVFTPRPNGIKSLPVTQTG